MHKVWAIAKREYLAAVQTKAFLVSLLLMPFLGGLSIVIQLIVTEQEIATTKSHAVIDRTGQLQGALDAAVERFNSGERNGARVRLVYVTPRNDIEAQRAELSERTRRGELEDVIEIGPEVFATNGGTDDAHGYRIQSDKASVVEVSRWVGHAINDAVQERRLVEHGLTPETVRQVQTPIPHRTVALTKRDAVTGAYTEASNADLTASIVLPLVFIMLMVLTTIAGVVPAMQGVVEEKQQRIAEVLLGCVRPFDLMLGKVCGTVAVSLTVSGVYIVGGAALAARFGIGQMLTPLLVGWFLLFLVLSSMTYAGLFLAIGAAATDMKETQALQMPVTMTMTLPLLLLGVMLRDPNGKLATTASFLPFCAPMYMCARLAGPTAIPWWHPIIAAIVTTGTMLGCLWIAGRVFRIGLLLQGQAPKLADLARWIRS